MNAFFPVNCFRDNNKWLCACYCKWVLLLVCIFVCILCDMYCVNVHESLCVWTLACSCLGHVWFLSAQRPPPCSQALLQGPKITSLSMLPGLWNNNTPGFPITTAPANGGGTENMCGQTRARGREEQKGSEQMAKVSSTETRLEAATSH